MPNRDGTGPHWAQQRPAPPTQDLATADATPAVAGIDPIPHPGCRGQGGTGRGLGRERRANGGGFGCGWPRWTN